MATLKKLRQRETMKIKKTLGIKNIGLARKIALINLGHTWPSDNLIAELDKELGEHKYNPGCKCCGDFSYTWETKKGYLFLQYHLFSAETKNPQR